MSGENLGASALKSHKNPRDSIKMLRLTRETDINTPCQKPEKSSRKRQLSYFKTCLDLKLKQNTLFQLD